MEVSSSTSSNSCSSSSPPPRLSKDLLKHIKNKHGDYEVDLRRENAFTSFMSVDRTMFRVFMAQFARVREIHFGFGSNIRMYRDSEKIGQRNKKDEQFYGPYLVTEAFVRALVDLRKLNLTSLRVSGYLDRWANSEQIKPAYSAIQSFCTLFLNKELTDEEAGGIRFELNQLRVFEGNQVLGSAFGDILNLNAKTMQIDLTEPRLFDCSSFDRSIDSKRTEKVCMKLKFSTDHDAEIGDLKLYWESLIKFLLDKCSAIRQIEFVINYAIRPYHYYAEVVIHHFAEMLEKFTGHIFPGLSEGSAEAQISVTLDLACDTTVQYEEIKEMGKEIFEKGEAVEHDYAGEYTARDYQITDKMGRVHKFAFRITAYEDSNSITVYEAMSDHSDYDLSEDFGSSSSDDGSYLGYSHDNKYKYFNDSDGW